MTRTNKRFLALISITAFSLFFTYLTMWAALVTLPLFYAAGYWIIKTITGITFKIGTLIAHLVLVALFGMGIIFIMLGLAFGCGKGGGCFFADYLPLAIPIVIYLIIAKIIAKKSVLICFFL